MTYRYQPGEQAMLSLRALYQSMGYLPFKMSKFEEYDLYAQSKEFLVSDSVITFTDRTGRLLALKPDVTLSIVKNYTYQPDMTEKICYDERVYRPGGGDGEYKELMQCGVECIGALDAVQIAQTVCLAAMSLERLGEGGVLQISHPGIVSALLDECGVPAELRSRILGYLGEKNAHDLSALCAGAGIDPSPLVSLMALRGEPETVLQRLAGLSDSPAFSEAYEELSLLTSMLSTLVPHVTVHLDFSILQDMRYYSGIVFRGYLPGIPERVLSGGRYDPLLRRMGKEGGAIGFAVYLDLIGGDEEDVAWDGDILLLYSEQDDPAAVCLEVLALSKDGARVSALKAPPEKLRYRQTVRFGGEGK